MRPRALWAGLDGSSTTEWTGFQYEDHGLIKARQSTSLSLGGASHVAPSDGSPKALHIALHCHPMQLSSRSHGHKEGYGRHQVWTA